MNTNHDTCSLTLSYKQANLTRYALLKHWDVIENDKHCSAEKKAAALADIDAVIAQLDGYIAMSKKVAA